MSASSRNAMELEANTKLKSSPRPYTAYNIFFQLEREYILQHDLNVTPNLSPEEIFEYSDKKYEGPALPPKYQGIILPCDWYIPGKALRKKRQHRASHGKISFVNLSKNISSSWHSCDDQVKLFCAQVSDIGMMKYKREMYNYKKKNCTIANKSESTSSEPKISSKFEKVFPLKQQTNAITCASMIRPENCPQITTSSLNLPIKLPLLPIKLSSKMDINNEPRGIHTSRSNVFGLVDTTICTSMFCPEICPRITTSSLNLPIELSSLPVELSSFLMDISNESRGVHTSRSNVFGLVDMQDSEIFNIWMSLDEPPRI